MKRRSTTEELDKSILMLLMPSFVGIVVSLFSLVGLTLAWFHTSMTVDGQNMTAANFDVVAKVKDASTNAEIFTSGKAFDLTSGTYEISISRCGTSKESSGYAIVEIGGTSYYTELLKLEEPFTFQIETDSETHFELTPHWGIETDSSYQKIDPLESLIIAGSTL